MEEIPVTSKDLMTKRSQLRLYDRIRLEVSLTGKTDLSDWSEIVLVGDPSDDALCEENVSRYRCTDLLLRLLCHASPDYELYKWLNSKIGFAETDDTRIKVAGAFGFNKYGYSQKQ